MPKPKKVRGGGPIVKGPPEVRGGAPSGPLDPWAAAPPAALSPWQEHWIPATASEREQARARLLARREVYVPPAAAKRVNAPLAETPSNGLSYNPDRASHQDVLGEATAYEMKKMEAEKKLRKTLKADKRLPDDRQADERALAEMVEFVRGGMQVKYVPGEVNADEEGEEKEKVVSKREREIIVGKCSL